MSTQLPEAHNYLAASTNHKIRQKRAQNNQTRNVTDKTKQLGTNQLSTKSKFTKKLILT